ncbi:MAG: LLM class flavin-dependent oxidoreductase [Acidimicrobiales bacterium]
MDFGVVLQCNPPAWRVIDQAKRAEVLGFSHVWLFGYVLWEEPYVLLAQVLAETRRVMVGPFVTNPARDATVLASLFATLNDLYGNRRSAASAGGTRRCGCRTAGPTLRAMREVHRGRPRAGQRPLGGLPGCDPAVPVGRPEPARRVGGGLRPQGAAAHR